MARYVERAENVARFIDVNLNLSLDLGPEIQRQWAPLVFTTGDHEDFCARYGEETQQNVIGFLTFDQENPNSIISCLCAARENARTIRDMISSEMWEELNKFYLMVRASAAGRIDTGSALRVLQQGQAGRCALRRDRARDHVAG